MSVFSLDCPDVGCYQNYLCDPEFQNKIIAVAFVRKSAASTINKTNADLWKASLFDAYIDGNAFLVFNTSGEKPKPETATTTGRGMQTTKALAKTHTLNYQDMQGVVLGNVEFYNQILSTSQNYDFYYFTPSRIWDASGNYITVIGDPIIGADINTYQTAEVSVTWTSKVNPLPYEFDTQTFLQGIYYNVAYEFGNDCIVINVQDQGPTYGTYFMTGTNQEGVVPTDSDVVWSVGSQTPDLGVVVSVFVGTTIEGAIGFDPTNAITGTTNIEIIASSPSGCVWGKFIQCVIVQ